MRYLSKPPSCTHVHVASNFAEVRHKLAEAEEEAARRGLISNEVPASVFIRTGLEIEEQQFVNSHSYTPRLSHYFFCYRRQLASSVKKKTPKSDHQIATLQEKRNALSRHIKKWQEIQVEYMPEVPATLPQVSEDDPAVNTEPVETIPLVFPSRLEPENRNRKCLHEVAEHERLLRMAQLQDSLVELRHTRKIRHRLLMNHLVQIAGQGQRASTRSRAVLASVEDRIAKYVERYRIAYQALLRLDPTGDWRKAFLELKDSDNRGPGKEREEERAGDGKYFRSWIWLVNPQATLTTEARPTDRTNGDADEGEAAEEGVDDEAEVETATQEEVNDVVRVEWTTAYARLARWAEEVDLLQEEMRRVVAFLEWKSTDWLARMDGRREKPTFDIRSGLNVYAQKQAAVYHSLAVSFVKLWYPTLESYGLEHSWVVDYAKNHNFPLPYTGLPLSRRSKQGIFKYRVSRKSQKAVTSAKPGLSRRSQWPQLSLIPRPS